MTTELIFVGTELLLGDIVNTNGAYLAKKCAALGLSLYYQSVVGDNEERLGEMIKTAAKRSDIVILCGGLGPTEDDLTKETAAKVMGKELVENKHSRKRISAYLENYVKGHADRKITENNWKQAMIPEGAIVIDNDNGTAPGVIMEEDSSTLILLPGPPNELIPMFEDKIFPYLRGRLPEIICSEVIKICGIGESQAEDQIRDLIQAQSNPTIATYAKTGEVHIRVTAKASSEKEARKLMRPLVRELKVRFGASIYTTDEEKTLETAVVELLHNQNLTLTTVESCTGGALSARIINVPGASEVLKQGFVTYSNRAKKKYIMVKKSTLKEHGAVSEKCAKEMAKGGCFITNSDAALSVTGLAGPDGGTEATPVGTVFIGCCLKGKTTVKEFHFNGSRNKVRDQAVTYALILLRECILENYENR
ncbi:MAG: competence/damage-inducible protein A [Firmicutes bacterium]|nr:competence/damage-inducible protein A [Blautia sp.]MDD7370644.1 competence/damage-inducible protein A [Bacillota bacterium]MDY3716075.1 competence/damage-inducible protein A [Blautia sp.]